MYRIAGLCMLLISGIILAQDNSTRAKAAFAFMSFETDCKCDGPENCKCVNCQCKNCNYNHIYSEAVKKNQVVILAVGCDVDIQPHRIIKLKALQGEKPSFIVGCPKGGVLHRLDFPATANREQVRLGILHFYYPLTAGYVECPTCPQGRIWVGRTR